MKTTPQRKLNIWLPFLFSVVLVVGMLIGTKMQSNPPTVAAIEIPKKESLPPSMMGQGKLEELIRYIEARYVDDVNKDELVKEAIDNILYQLDPHSSYISASHLKEVNDQLEGHFDGIGIEFIVVDDTVMIVKTLQDGPAFLAGIEAGDKIVEIEDSLTVGDNIDYEGILGKLKGTKGSKVKVGVKRNNKKELHYFTITRDKIPVKSVEVAYMLNDKTGLIKINRFTANTYQEFMEAIEDLVENHGMEHVVIDLRDNPGGYLQEATNILSQLFKEKEKLLVYTEGINVTRSEYKTTGRNFYDVKNIAVLVDEGSASASEILAGAIQDWDRGVIVGRRTFGKGLVQEQYRLRDGSAIRLTVARYFTPSGRCIQKPYDSKDTYDDDLADRTINGELYGNQEFEIVDTTKYFTGAGRTVYGGGGIIPDVFVPLDSNLLRADFITLRQFVQSFAFRFLEKHRSDWADKQLTTFAEEFSIDDNLMIEFYNYADVQAKAKQARLNRKMDLTMRKYIKATIAHQLWSENGYFKIMNEEDPVVTKALNMMSEEDPLSALNMSDRN
ncbi:MAG: S41 family peptidase [Bacteroidota bacterium]